MGMKKVNGKVYYSGTSENPITTRLSIYEIKNGRPNYITQAEFLKKIGLKTMGSGLTSIKGAMAKLGKTSFSVGFKDKIFVFTYYNSFSYFNRERPDLLTHPDCFSKKDLFKKGCIGSYDGNVIYYIA